MEKNKTLIAVVLSVMVIIGFQTWMAKQYPQSHVRRQEAGTIAEPQSQPQSTAPLLPAKAAATAALKAEEEYIVETEKFILTFSNIGGSIKRIELKEFADHATGMPYELIDAKDPRFYTAAFSLINTQTDQYAIYQMARDGMQITFKHDADGMQITKTYRLHRDSDSIELYITLSNTSGREMKTSSQISAGSSMNASDAMSQRYINISAKIGGKVFKDRRSTSHSGDVSWVALNSKYFTILLRPFQIGHMAITSVLENEAAHEKRPI